MLVTGDEGLVVIGSAAVADITLWRFQTRVRSVAYASSGTGGYRKRIAGAREGLGQIQFRLDLAAPAWNQLAEGSSVTLKLHLDGTRHYLVPAVIETLQLEVDVAQGRPIAGEASFVADGPWSGPVS